MSSTKDNWKGDTHSFPRAPQTHDEGQYSCKATSSSSTSLNIVNKGQHSSVSPKPFNKQQNSGINALRIQEMQKEVNLMYLGSGIAANKKKAGAGVKLNPIVSRGGDNSYVL
jgi:hypothetical protein